LNSTTHFHPFSKPVQDHWTKHPGGYVGNEHGGNTPQGYWHSNLEGTNALGNVTGKHATIAILSAIVANTVLAKAASKQNWWNALDEAGWWTGYGMVLGGIFPATRGIDDDNPALLAAGGALIGLGIAFIGPNFVHRYY
tara:strand:+ start:333 stop:749 length:417 start_codon:yes stop_codon:yes gene_type:complete